MIFNRIIIIISFLSLFLALSQSAQLIEVNSTSPLSTGEINITTIYSENCTEPTANNFIADWKFGISVTNAPNNAISYQRNSEVVLSHTLTGTTDTLTISGIPADGGASDTIKVWFTSEPTCGDTVILKRPVPCPTNLGGTAGSFCKGSTTTTTVFYADFENTTGDNNWTFGLGATDGNWEIGVPSPYVQSSTTTMELSAFEGSQDLLTGNGGSQDLDGGPTTARSPNITLPTGTTTLDLSFQYYFSHFTNGEVTDYLTVELRRNSDNMTLVNLVNETGAATDRDAVWTALNSNLLAHAGETVYIFAEASDPNTGGKVEAAIDVVEIVATTVVPPSSIGSDEIVGCVWEDFNYNGKKDETSLMGVQGVQVLAYDCDNNLVRTSYTDVNGNYNFTGLTAGGNYRIEFVLPESVSCWAKPTKSGTENGTMVQFVQPGNCAGLGIASPADYCESNPTLLTTCFVNGDPSDASVSGMDALVTFKYDASNKTTVSDVGTVGSSWGVAFDKVNQRYFTSTVLKRHSGIADDLGTIYVANPISATPVAFTTLSNVGSIPSNAARGITTLTAPSQDQTIFGEIGKLGIGDIDVSENGNTLYAVNLNTRRVVAIDIATQSETELPAFPEPGCNNGVARPWGLKVYRGAIYLGVVCSGENGGTQSDLTASVMKYENGNWTQLISYGLDFQRGCAYEYGATVLGCGGWSPWFDDNTSDPITTYVSGHFFGYPTPILSDIEFTENGSMLMGFMDRSGMQYGFHNNPPHNSTDTDYSIVTAGDILVAHNIDGTLVIENNGASGEPTTSGQSNNQGPNGGEFIYDDTYVPNPAFPNNNLHNETSFGAIAVLKGTNELVISMLDPGSLNSGGIGWFSSTLGISTDSLLLYDGDLSDGTLGKGIGIGDVELLCGTAPLEIGNYVWFDENENGIQDACEPGIENVRIELYNLAGDLIAFDTTDANGQYYFSHSNSTDQNWIAATDSVEANTMYYISVGGGDFKSDVLSVGGTTYALTTTDATSTNNSDEKDSDGTIASGIDPDFDGKPYLKITTGAVGNADHSFDFGFKEICVISIAVTSQNCSGTNSFTADWQVIVTYSGEPAGNISYQRNSDAVGSFTPNTSPDTITIAGIPADGGKSDTIRVYFANEPTCGDTSILIRPTPCPTPLPNESGEVCTGLAADELGGTVFEDWNYDGIMNQSDTIGVAGIKVYMYDCAGAVVDSTYTDANGNYKFTGLGTGPLSGKTKEEYRIEFVLPESVSCWASPTQAGADNGSTVQFVEPGNCASLGLANAADYCQEVSFFAVPCYDAGTTSGSTSGNPAFVSVDYGFTTKSTLATIGDLGATWGVAYHKTVSDYYAASFLKRNVGLSEGLGHIHIVNANTGYKGSFDLQGVNGIEMGSVDRSSGSDYTLASGGYAVDLDAFGKVGTVGYGDIDIYNENTLTLVNLNSKSLINMDISNTASLPIDGSAISGALVTEYPLTFPDACNSGEMRPFGLKYHKGTGYLGVVCDASISQDSSDLWAYVYSFEPTNIGAGLTKVIDFRLDYTKEDKGNYGGVNRMDGEWVPWSFTWDDLNKHTAGGGTVWAIDNASPMLSDIEFTEDGSMILAFSDRVSHQIGTNAPIPVATPNGITPSLSAAWAGGDLIKVCLVNGTYVMEGATGCPVNEVDIDGLSGTGEFYYLDEFGAHFETTTGAIAYRKGSNFVTSTIYDATAINQPGGLAKFHSLNGQDEGRFVVIPANETQFDKATGLGDLELLCNPAPIEIGNYVWEDTNGDGIQGACEPGIASVNVTLYTATGDSLTTVLTDANGQYYFNSATPGLDTILPNTMYFIVVGESGQFDTGTNVLNIGDISYIITADSIGQGTLPRQNDSDGTLANNVDADFDGQPYLTIITGSSGSVDHTFDFGFIPRYDYGDLPDIANGTTGINDYETYDSTGGPSHLIIPGLFLGDTVDVDTDGFPNAQALGDDNDGIDDEDGVIIFPKLNARPGGTIRLPLSMTNTTGNLAYLEAWIDWNGDGDFLDANEMVVNVDDIGTGSFSTHVEIMIPNNALTESSLGFRVRYSNTNDMTPYGRVNSGEVEDYLLRIDCSDNVCLPIQGEIKKE